MKPMSTAEDTAPAVRLSIQGRHGLFLVQRDTEEVMVDAKDQAAPHCTCRLHHPEGTGDCEHITLLRACGFLERAA